MEKYKITEKQDVNSVREGYEIEAKDLAQAKRVASKNQVFFGTVLTIESAKTGALLSVKENWRWV